MPDTLDLDSLGLTPVEILREAAALMRQRAEAATWARHADEQVPTWTYDGNPSGAVMAGRWCVGQASAYGDGRGDNRLADHIASWHPAVALAVAEVLDTWADLGLLDSGGTLPRERDAILAVARAYLRDEAP